MVQKYNQMITYYTPTSRNLKTPKTRLCNNNPNYSRTNRVAKTTTLHEREVLFTFIVRLFLCLVLFLHCLVLGFGSLMELYIFGNLSAGGKDHL